jgi:hypothetical protein
MHPSDRWLLLRLRALLPVPRSTIVAPTVSFVNDFLKPALSFLLHACQQLILCGHATAFARGVLAGRPPVARHASALLGSVDRHAAFQRTFETRAALSAVSNIAN